MKGSPAAAGAGTLPVGRAKWGADFGAVGDGLADDTDALNDGLQWAAEQRGVLLLDPGFYAIRSLEMAGQAALQAVAAGMSRFAKDGRHIPAVLVPVLGRRDDEPLLTMSGTGGHLSGVGVSGYNFRQGGDPDDPAQWTSSPGIVVRGGIEVVLSGVRVFRVANSGIRVEQLNNARWRDVFVDDCGTATDAAVRIESKECSNYLYFDGLTIERAANTALDIATGDDPVRDCTANIIFAGLHIESNNDGASHHALNGSPLIDIGNVRAVTFLAPQLLGYPAPLVRYRQTIRPDVVLSSRPGGDARDQQGGVQFFGGHLKQHGGGDAPSRVATVEVLGNGRGLEVNSVKFDALWCPGVLVRASYQQDVRVSGGTFRRAGAEAGYPESIEDERSDGVRRALSSAMHGWHRLTDGSLILDGGSLYVSEGTVQLGTGGLVVQSASTTSKTTTSARPGVASGWVSPSRGAGTDNAGRTWCRANVDVNGELFSVRFERPRDETPVVVLTPRNATAASANAFAEQEVGPDGEVIGFTISAANAVPKGSGVLYFDYVVIGCRR